MQDIVIFGAASGLGAALVEFFSQDQFHVIAITRETSNLCKLNELGIKPIFCDALNKEQIETVVHALPKNAVVISPMGNASCEPSVDYLGHKYLINALEKADIKRFLMITSLGCGDSWQFLSDRAKKVFGHAVREKSLAESWLQSSELDFTIIRPGGLMNGEVTNTGKLYQQVETHGIINRLEVARICADLLNDATSIGQIYQCVDPNLVY